MNYDSQNTKNIWIILITIGGLIIAVVLLLYFTIFKDDNSEMEDEITEEELAEYKETTMNSILNYIAKSTTHVNDLDFGLLSDSNTIYYIPVSSNDDETCVKISKEDMNFPLGEWEEAYIGVRYNPEKYMYEYYFTFYDENGYGFKLTRSYDFPTNGEIITQKGLASIKNGYMTEQLVSGVNNSKVLLTPKEAKKANVKSCDVSTAKSGNVNDSISSEDYNNDYDYDYDYDEENNNNNNNNNEITSSNISEVDKEKLYNSIITFVNESNTAINDQEFGALYSPEKIYYVEVGINNNTSCVNYEKDVINPLGEWDKAYVVAHYIPSEFSYDYYFTFRDKSGYGMSLTKIDNITFDLYKLQFPIPNAVKDINANDGIDDILKQYSTTEEGIIKYHTGHKLEGSQQIPVYENVNEIYVIEKSNNCMPRLAFEIE